MLDYTKTILEKVSFSPELFQKELMKATLWLGKEELPLLQSWCLISFSEPYKDIINKVFDSLN